MKGKFKTIAMTVSLVFVVVMAAAAGVSGYWKQLGSNQTGGGGNTPTEKIEVIKPTDAINAIMQGAQKASAAGDGYTFNIDAEAAFYVSDGETLESRFDLKVNLSFDLDPNKNTADNLYIIELTKDEGGLKKHVVDVYYKDSLVETPYLYVGVGGEKHAIKFFSVKKAVTGQGSAAAASLYSAGAPEADGWTIQGLLDALPLGEYSDFVGAIVRNFILDGPKSIFKNAYVSDKDAGFEIDMSHLRELISIAVGMVSQIDGVQNTFDDLMQIAGINLSFDGLKNALTNLPEMQIKVDSALDNGTLKSLSASVTFVGGLDIDVDTNEGKPIADIHLPGGKTYGVELIKLDVYTGEPFGDFGEYINTAAYVRHSLINFETGGVVRLENIVEITPDGKKLYGVSSGKDYAIEIKADLDPFALLNGIGKESIEESIKKMGRFNLFIYNINNSGTVGTFIEIAFDPERSGDDCIYATFSLQGNASLAGQQTLKFDVSDLLEWLGLYAAANSANQASAYSAKTTAAAVKDGGQDEGLNFGAANEAFEIIKDSEFGPLAFAIYPYRIDALAGMADYLVGNGGERMFFALNRFVYGSVPEDFDDYTRLKSNGVFPLSATIAGVPEQNKLLTEYEYGQAFQNGYDTVDMIVTYNNKLLAPLVEQHGLKVIKRLGFDPFTPGRQHVTLFLITPPHNAMTSKAVYDAFADGGLPYGLIKFEYDITVREPKDVWDYSFIGDDIAVGENIFNKQIKAVGANGEIKTLSLAEAFTLYKFDANADGQKGAVSRGITADGYAAVPGKYIIEATVNGETFSQVLYINELIFPDMSKALVAGRPVSDLDATITYYDETLGCVVKEIIRAVNPGATSSSKVYLDISGDVIKGSGKRYGQGLSDPTEIKYTYYIAANGAKTQRTRSYGYPVVIVEEPVLKFLAAVITGRQFYAGSRITFFGELVRSDGLGNTFVANTSNVGTSIAWVNGRYMILDKEGNIIADEIRLTIHSGTAKGSPDVTADYYDAATGRLKFPASKLPTGGNPSYGSASVANLKMEFSAWYRGKKFEYPSDKVNTYGDDGYATFTLWQQIRTAASTYAITVKQGQLFPTSLFSAYSTDISGSPTNFQTRFDYKAGRYYLASLNNIKKSYLTFKIYDAATKAEITAPVFDAYGGVTLPTGKYDMKVSAVVNGVEVVYDYTGKLTIDAPVTLTAVKGDRIKDSGSYDMYFNVPFTGLIGSGKFTWTEARGYHITTSSTGATYYEATDIRVLDQDGSLVDNPFIDGYKINLEAGTYTLLITYFNGECYVTTTATLKVS
ncbi:MAG: hypothetical protein LBQ40_01615 [Clostridiales bacterium]|jgi:hypothetical protein|nr:hypothetical protein [Clostridiales bacterium]